MTATWKDKSINFDSWGEYVDFAVTSQPIGHFRSSRDEQREDRWDFGVGFDGAVKLAESGWSEASQEVSLLADRIVERTELSLTHPELVYDVQGSDFDVATMLTGVPEYWSRLEHTAEIKTIKLVFNCSTSARVNSKVMKTKGAIVAALVHTLELSNIRVEVVLAFNQSSEYEVTAKLKDAEQPLDIDRLTFALAHPASFRRLGFAVLESNADFMSKYYYSYGHPAEVSKQNQGDIYINKSHLYDPSYASPEVAANWVLEQLKAQGVEVTSN